jgi:hypothetical protein
MLSRQACPELAEGTPSAQRKNFTCFSERENTDRTQRYFNFEDEEKLEKRCLAQRRKGRQGRQGRKITPVPVKRQTVWDNS